MVSTSRVWGAHDPLVVLRLGVLRLVVLVAGPGFAESKERTRLRLVDPRSLDGNVIVTHHRRRANG